MRETLPPPPLPAASTSSFVILPLGPVPWMVRRSILRSLARRLIAGDVDMVVVLLLVVVVDKSSAAAAAAVSVSLLFSSSTSMCARISPTCTTEPAVWLSFLTVPAKGEVISTVALSDWTSHNLPNDSTVSPSPIYHWMSSHSLIPSPGWASLSQWRGWVGLAGEGKRWSLFWTKNGERNRFCVVVKDGLNPSLPELFNLRRSGSKVTKEVGLRKQ